MNEVVFSLLLLLNEEEKRIVIRDRQWIFQNRVSVSFAARPAETLPCVWYHITSLQIALLHCVCFPDDDDDDGGGNHIFRKPLVLKCTHPSHHPSPFARQRFYPWFSDVLQHWHAQLWLTGLSVHPTRPQLAFSHTTDSHPIGQLHKEFTITGVVFSQQSLLVYPQSIGYLYITHVLSWDYGVD